MTAISTISAMTRRAPDFTDVMIDLEVYDLKHLTDIHRAVARQADGGESGAGEWLIIPSRLGVNIDHVATIRNARGGALPIRCAPPSWRLRPAATASPRICAKTAAISATTTSRG